MRSEIRILLAFGAKIWVHNSEKFTIHEFTKTVAFNVIVYGGFAGTIQSGSLKRVVHCKRVYYTEFSVYK